MDPRDTSDPGRRAQLDIWRTMTGPERLNLALQLTDDVRDMARAGIRHRHPNYTGSDIEHALHRLLLGDAIADQVWPAHRHLIP